MSSRISLDREISALQDTKKKIIKKYLSGPVGPSKSLKKSRKVDFLWYGSFESKLKWFYKVSNLSTYIIR